MPYRTALRRLTLPAATAISLFTVPGIAWALDAPVRPPVIVAQAVPEVAKDEEKRKTLQKAVEDAAEKAKSEAGDKADSAREDDADAEGGEEPKGQPQRQRQRAEPGERGQPQQRGEPGTRGGQADDAGERPAPRERAAEPEERPAGATGERAAEPEQKRSQEGGRAAEQEDKPAGETREQAVEEEAAPAPGLSDEEKARAEERTRQRMERRRAREAGEADERAPGAAGPAPKEVEELKPVAKETVRREGGAEVRSQTFRTGDGRQIEKTIRVQDDGDKVIVTRTRDRQGRTVERRRVLDHAGDDELERRVVPLVEIRGGRDRDRDRYDRRRDGRDRDRDRRGRRDWRDRDRDRADIRIVIRAPRQLRIPLHRYVVEAERAEPELIYQTLTAPPVREIERRYTIDEVRQSEYLRASMPRVDLDTITFGFDQARVPDAELGRLEVIAEGMRRAIRRNPEETFLLEGHTDAVGSELYNLELSEARALSVKYALADAFGIPEENLVTEGYGEEYLKVPTEEAERLNRRVTVRRITPLVSSRQ